MVKSQGLGRSSSVGVFASLVGRAGFEPARSRAFDVQMLDSDDVRGLALLERKRRVLEVMPRIESRVRYVDHVHESSVRFFKLACVRDLEGLVVKYEQRKSPVQRPRRNVTEPTLRLTPKTGTRRQGHEGASSLGHTGPACVLQLSPRAIS